MVVLLTMVAMLTVVGCNKENEENRLEQVSNKSFVYDIPEYHVAFTFPGSWQGHIRVMPLEAREGGYSSIPFYYDFGKADYYQVFELILLEGNIEKEDAKVQPLLTEGTKYLGKNNGKTYLVRWNEDIKKKTDDPKINAINKEIPKIIDSFVWRRPI